MSTIKTDAIVAVSTDGDLSLDGLGSGVVSVASTLKTDTITAVSANGDLSLDGLGTGGVSIASTLKMTKGGDIASASPLVIDVDGNYFDVTGTTNFSAMTVESGNFFMLQFDGALTITHGSGIELPGAANLTTATGDRLMCYATAANTVEVMSVETEAAASAGFTLATPQATTSGTSVTFGSIPSGTKIIHVLFDAVGFTSNVNADVTIGDSGGLETSGYVFSGARLGNDNFVETINSSSEFIIKSTNAVYELSGILTLALQNSSTFTWVGSYTMRNHSSQVVTGGGMKDLSAELTQVSISGGTFDTGAVSILYQ